MSSMVHGLRAKGSTAALINSENPMWPVAEFSSVRYCVYSPARPERAVAAELAGPVCPGRELAYEYGDAWPTKAGVWHRISIEKRAPTHENRDFLTKKQASGIYTENITFYW